MNTYPNRIQTPSGAKVQLQVPTHMLAAANITDGMDSPFPSESVDEEISYFRYALAKKKLYTKVISVRATPHCTIKYIVLDRDNLQDRVQAKHFAERFCITSDYLYTS